MSDSDVYYVEKLIEIRGGAVVPVFTDPCKPWERV